MSELFNPNFTPEAPDNSERVSQLEKIARYIRKDAFETIRTANSGHVGGSSSSVELLTCLYFGGRFNFDPDDSKNINRDLVLTRGHEGPVRYPIFSLLGYIERDELSTYRRLGSRLQGHEDMHETPGVDITPSGSLGMLLSYGVGSAITSKDLGLSNRTIVFLGDGEEQEGNVSEAARHASSLALDNLICIIDKNSKQLSRPTSHSDGSADLAKIWNGYGWSVLEIDNGHSIEDILKVYEELQSITQPTVVIANTIKGYGIEGSEEHFSGYHTLSAIPDHSVLDNAIERLSADQQAEGIDQKIKDIGRALVSRPILGEKHQVPSIDAYNIEFNGSGKMNLEHGQSLFFNDLRARINADATTAPLYTITPDLLRSDIVEDLGLEDFSHFIDTGIREQHAIAMAHGISATNPDARIYVCYGDAFAFRAMDQMNAAAQGGSNILVAGENSGIFQGENGKTHQSVGQPGALMQIPEATLYEPADVQDLYNVFTHILSKNTGFNYVRLHRGEITTLEREKSDEKNIGAYVVHRPDKAARFVIAASGFMLENAIGAAQILEIEHNLPTAVINVVNQKKVGPVLQETLQNDAPILTVYNGNPATLQANVSKAIFESTEIPRPAFVSGHGFIGGTSGNVRELIKHYRFDAKGIAQVALQSIATRNGRH